MVWFLRVIIESIEQNYTGEMLIRSVDVTAGAVVVAVVVVVVLVFGGRVGG